MMSSTIRSGSKNGASGSLDHIFHRGLITNINGQLWIFRWNNERLQYFSIEVAVDGSVGYGVPEKCTGFITLLGDLCRDLLQKSSVTLWLVKQLIKTSSPLSPVNVNNRLCIPSKQETISLSQSGRIRLVFVASHFIP